MVSGTLSQDSESLKFLKEFYLLPGEPEEILLGKTELDKLGSSFFETALSRSNVDPAPLGFWPEPLAATALAVADRTGAIEEILAWLYLARLHYGYAWRVLLDWRYFDEVKQHPRFQVFLHEEDEAVAEVERKIDKGDFPL